MKTRDEMYGPAEVQALADAAARESGDYDTERLTGEPDDGFLDGFGESAFRAGFWQGWQAHDERARAELRVVRDERDRARAALADLVSALDGYGRPANGVKAIHVDWSQTPGGTDHVQLVNARRALAGGGETPATEETTDGA